MNIFKKIIFSLGVIVLAILIFLITLLFVIRNIRIKDLIEQRLRQELGLKVTIGKLNFSPLLTHIGASDITVYNPPGFNEKELAYISSIHFVFDPLEIISRAKPDIYIFTLDLKRLNIVKNQEGKVNIKELYPIKQETTPKNVSPFYFDVMVLSIGELYYTEYTASGKKTKKYTIGLENQAFVKFIDEDQLIRLIIYKAIENTDVGKLINLKVIPIVSGVSDTMSAAWGTAKLGLKSAVEIATFPFQLLFGK